MKYRKGWMEAEFKGRRVHCGSSGMKSFKGEERGRDPVDGCEGSEGADRGKKAHRELSLRGGRRERGSKKERGLGTGGEPFLLSGVSGPVQLHSSKTGGKNSIPSSQLSHRVCHNQSVSWVITLCSLTNKAIPITCAARPDQ